MRGSADKGTAEEIGRRTWWKLSDTHVILEESGVLGVGRAEGLTHSSEFIILAFTQARVKQNKETHVYYFFTLYFILLHFTKVALQSPAIFCCTSK